MKNGALKARYSLTVLLGPHISEIMSRLQRLSLFVLLSVLGRWPRLLHFAPSALMQPQLFEGRALHSYRVNSKPRLLTVAQHAIAFRVRCLPKLISLLLLLTALNTSLPSFAQDARELEQERTASNKLKGEHPLVELMRTRKSALRPELLARGMNDQLSKLFRDGWRSVTGAGSSSRRSTKIRHSFQEEQVCLRRLHASAFATNGKAQQDAAGLVEHLGKIRT